jgi:hypothetical protein
MLQEWFNNLVNSFDNLENWAIDTDLNVFVCVAKTKFEKD